MSDLNAADVLALTRENGGFLEGNGIIILLLFLLFMGGGFGSFGGNNAAVQGALTRADIQDTIQGQNLTNGINALNMGMNNSFAGLTMGMNNGFNSVNSAISNLGFQMQSCCCDLKSTMTDQTIQNLRDKLEDKDRELNSAIFAASQLTQTRTLEDFILANK